MKKCFIIGLIMAMMPNMGIGAGFKSVDQLIAEKQAKMEKLKKCKGTTKNLKIAGISTLGITAVGIGVNIAEAVKLDEKKSTLETERTNLTKAEEKNAELKSKQGKTNTSTKKYDGGCDKYVAEVYDAVKDNKGCPEYSNMNICKEIKSIKIDDKDDWVKKAKEVCEKNTKKNAEKTFKSVCNAKGSLDTTDNKNVCKIQSKTYLADVKSAKNALKETIDAFKDFKCDINEMTNESNDYSIKCSDTDTILIVNKDIDEEFKNNCKTVLMQNPKHNNGSEGVDEENSCTVTVGTQTSVANESALKKKAKEYADKMGDVCTDATIANYTDSNVAAGKARFRIVCKAGKIQNALYVMFNNVKCTTTGQTYKQDGCKD